MLSSSPQRKFSLILVVISSSSPDSNYCPLNHAAEMGMPSFLPLILKWVGESALIFFFLLHGSKEQL
jgi:hypothetical protein